MRIKLIIGTILFSLMSGMSYGQERIMVLSDPHVLESSLMDTSSLSFKTMQAEQRKMIDLSEAAFTALVDTALKYKPSLVLIPGDLTKDSEKASHDAVVAQLQRLQAEGISTLLIPGNHDIGGKAYAYLGDEAVEVEHLADEAWETQYAMVYSQAVAKDASSHSFAAEPLKGLTVLGIDGAHNAASTGSLSKQTLAWLTAQADTAVKKGNMIIAMCHWQLMEHFDKQSTMFGSGMLSDAAMVRDSLMKHGVHLVLTGHFHVNGITTYRDTTGVVVDSLVEITTGAPITYPCPYRWLTLSEDRSTVSVETEILASLPGYPELEAYSRDWMAEHVTDLLPRMTTMAFEMAEAMPEMIANSSLFESAGVSENVKKMLVEALIGCIPTDDSVRIELVKRHLGPQIVELYLVHSEANEPENPEAQVVADSLYTGIYNMAWEITSSSYMLVFMEDVRKAICAAAPLKARGPVQSLVEDKTNWKSAKYSDLTDDLRPDLAINKPRLPLGVDNQTTDESAGKSKKILQNGQLFIRRNGSVYTVTGAEVTQKIQPGVENGF